MMLLWLCSEVLIWKAWYQKLLFLPVEYIHCFKTKYNLQILQPCISVSKQIKHKSMFSFEITFRTGKIIYYSYLFREDNFNHRKTKIMTTVVDGHEMFKINEEEIELVQEFFFLGSKIVHNGNSILEIKWRLTLGIG